MPSAIVAEQRARAATNDQIGLHALGRQHLRVMPTAAMLRTPPLPRPAPNGGREFDS
jgi:hypothetical protein